MRQERGPQDVQSASTFDVRAGVAVSYQGRRQLVRVKSERLPYIGWCHDLRQDGAPDGEPVRVSGVVRRLGVRLISRHAH